MKLHPTLKNVFKNGAYHLLFWWASFYVLINVFASSSEFQKIDYLYTGAFLISVIIPVYVNLFVLAPYYLQAQKYLWFVILLATNLFVFSFFNHLLFNSWIDYILPGYYFISYYTYGDILKFFASFFFLTLLLKLTQEWFQLNEIRGKMIGLEKEKAEAELKALTYQVNPHFLFNSLNVLYSLAIRESKKTPEAIIDLSDLLRYVIYDSSSDFVKLGSEIGLIKKYINLQKYRVSKEAKIDLEIDVDDEDISIAPMMFLPLLENSFKHGMQKETSRAYLIMKLMADESTVTFVIENNKSEVEDDSYIHSAGGVGLENIKSRLKLIYPQKHKFIVDDKKDFFKVELYIELQ